MEIDNSGKLEESLNCAVALVDPSTGITTCSVDPAPPSSCCCGSDVIFWGWWEFAPDCGSIIGPLDFSGLVQNLVVGKRTRPLQSGQVEFECSQWCMQSMWNTCLHDGIWRTSSLISNSPKQTQHLQPKCFKIPMESVEWKPSTFPFKFSR